LTDRKKLKREYKDTIQPMGIYSISNLRNGKILIGSALDLKGKLNSIKFQLEMGSYINKELQKDFNLFGQNNFSFEILDYLEPKEDQGHNYAAELKVLEEIWLEKLQPYDLNGYNLRNDSE
jgi:group I intron endonuclease